MKLVSNLIKRIEGALSWAGNHLGTILTIFSVVAGVLFVRERNKRISLETDLQLDEQADKVKEAKKETENARKQANNSLDDFNAADAEYQRSKRGKED